jgi:hypothetical protein
MKRPASNRTWNIFLTATVFVAIGLGVVYALTPNVPKSQMIEGRPLLELEGPDFIDKQVGVTFTPPSGWAMQERSTESPTAHQAERMVVKFKRLVPGPIAAWLKLNIADVTGDPSPAELIRTRKPREAHFVMTKEPEDGLTIAGRPASRVTFGGELDTDRQGSRHCTTEIVAMRHGKIAVYFAGTFTTTNQEAQKLIRNSIESTVFDRR